MIGYSIIITPKAEVAAPAVLAHFVKQTLQKLDVSEDTIRTSTHMYRDIVPPPPPCHKSLSSPNTPNRKHGGAKKRRHAEKLKQQHISANNNTAMLIPVG